MTNSGEMSREELSGERSTTPVALSNLHSDWRHRGVFLALVATIVTAGMFWSFHRFHSKKPTSTPMDPVADGLASPWAHRFTERAPESPTVNHAQTREMGTLPVDNSYRRPEFPQMSAGISQDSVLPLMSPVTSRASQPELSAVVASPRPSALDAPVMVAASRGGSDADRIASSPMLDSLTEVRQPSSERGGVSSLLQDQKREGAQATRLLKRSMLLATGSMIECALQTHLDSTLPGLTSCIVTRDVYSDDGRMILIERGSLVTGEYRSSVREGQHRIFVIWTRVKTPLGVVVNLSSPATDPLGGSGIEGDVNEHWFERIGAAFLLSLIQDGIAIEETSNQRGTPGSQTVVLPNTGQTGNRMADRVLENTIEIPTTLSKNQGARVAIFVARDLYFDSVYELATD